MGHLGTTASHELLQNCDTLLLVGTNDPWTEFYPPPGQARAVQIDIDGRRLGVRYPVEVPLLGDAAETLRALLPLLRPRDGGRWRERVESAVRRWHEVAAARASAAADPVNPQFLVRELSGRLPADAQVSVDVGSVTYWYARHLRLPPGVPAHLSSTLASMGSALPYGLAAKFAAPQRPVVALAGDGAMQMNGLAELITVAARWREWSDPRFVVCVLNNRDLAEVSWEQRETEGETPSGHDCSVSTVCEWSRRTRSGRRGTGRCPPIGRSSSTRWSTRPFRCCRRGSRRRRCARCTRVWRRSAAMWRAAPRSTYGGSARTRATDGGAGGPRRFSGSTSTGPRLATVSTTLSKVARICGAAPAKCRSRSPSTAQVWVCRGLANVRPRRGHSHIGRSPGMASP
jgi:hypothetical protein